MDVHRNFCSTNFHLARPIVLFFFFLLFFDECLPGGIFFSDFTRTTRSGIIGYEGKSIRGMFDEWNIIFRFHANDSIGYNRIGKKKVGRLTSGILFSDLDLYI